MQHSNISLVLAGVPSFGLADFQAAISFVLAWSAALGARDELLPTRTCCWP